jgi:DNA-binding IclR family transcriptional regulator
MLGILELFAIERPFWTSEQIMEHTGFSRPTTFRYLKELRDAGLLARFSGGYVLGAKAVKLDYIIRQSDPLLHLFHPIMARLRDDTDCDIILATLFGHEFLATIHESSGTTDVSWPRGRPMPLVRGAGGLAVLASLAKAQQRRLLAHPAVAATIDDAAALHQHVAQVAADGYAISLGELDPTNVGVAIPVTLANVPASALVMVMGRKRFATADRAILVRLLREAREEMLAAYAAQQRDGVAAATAGPPPGRAAA